MNRVTFILNYKPWYKQREKGREAAQTYHELHVAELVQHLAHLFSDDGKGYFVVALCRRLNGVPGHLIKRDHVFQHSCCLVEWAESRQEPRQQEKRFWMSHTRTHCIFIRAAGQNRSLKFCTQQKITILHAQQSCVTYNTVLTMYHLKQYRRENGSRVFEKIR